MLEPSAQVALNAPYVKQSMRNRIDVVHAQGLHRITVPVHRPSGETCSQFELRLVDDGWSRRFLQSLRTCYGAAPYFDHFFDEVSGLIGDSDTLGDLNLKSIRWCASELDLSFEVNTASNRVDTFDLADRWLEPAYLRVFSDRSDFVQGASVLDALFHLGPEAARHIESIERRDACADKL